MRNRFFCCTMASYTLGGLLIGTLAASGFINAATESQESASTSIMVTRILTTMAGGVLGSFFGARLGGLIGQVNNTNDRLDNLERGAMRPHGETTRLVS